MLDLPDVTLCAVFTVCHGPSRLAIDECASRVKFGDVRVFTDQPRPGEVLVDKFADLWAAGKFTTREVP